MDKDPFDANVLVLVYPRVASSFSNELIGEIP